MLPKQTANDVESVSSTAVNVGDHPEYQTDLQKTIAVDADGSNKASIKQENKYGDKTANT